MKAAIHVTKFGGIPSCSGRFQTLRDASAQKLKSAQGWESHVVGEVENNRRHETGANAIAPVQRRPL
jgi:hypothetical protein